MSMLLFQLKSGDFEAVMVSMYYQGFDYREITFVGKVNSNPEAELKEFQPLAETPITGSNLKTLNKFEAWLKFFKFGLILFLLFFVFLFFLFLEFF